MTERDIFLAVLDLPDAPARAAYLDRTCRGNTELRSKVEALLRNHDSAGSFLGRPAVSLSAPHDSGTQELAANSAPPEGFAFLGPAQRPDSLGRLGHYEILQVLGRGAFGIVFRAFDESLHRMVALKVLATELADNGTARKRFLREARAAAALSHEHIVNVFAVDEQPVPYLVMEYVKGQTLQDKLDSRGPATLPEVLRIGQQIAEGLAAAHAIGLIHRDIKPANILLENGVERVKISDFGLARSADDAHLTQSGVICGTPMYMAPEQAQDEAIDQRTDLFSLGSVLYALCTGLPPFRAGTTVGVLKRVCEEKPRPIREINAEIPSWLCDIIGRLNAKKPDERYPSARVVAELLGRCLAEYHQHGQVSSKAHGTSAAPAQPRRRRWPGAAAAALVLVLLGLGWSEANGVTNVRRTVVRLFSPEGTLIVEVDDPSVSVTVDGDDTIITGAGVREIRLKAGQYKVKATRDGKTVREELVRVERDGRQVVRVSREANPGQVADDEAAWVKSVAALPAQEQLKAVLARLRQLNPDFVLDELRERVVDEQVTEFEVIGNGMRDLAPIRALPALRALRCVRGPSGQSVVPDLAALKGLTVREVSLRGLPIVELGGLVGLPIEGLELTSTKVVDLKALRQLPLKGLHVAFTPLTDLTPLRGLKLEDLNLDGTQVEDLAPLKGQPLKSLGLAGTRVVDLAPLKEMPLVYFGYRGTQVKDIAALKNLPLERVDCDYQPDRDAAILRSIKTLETINGKPASQLWKEVEGK